MTPFAFATATEILFGRGQAARRCPGWRRWGRGCCWWGAHRPRGGIGWRRGWKRKALP